MHKFSGMYAILVGQVGVSPPSLTTGTNFLYNIVHVAGNVLCFSKKYCKNCARAEALPKTQASLCKGRYGTKHLSQRRARWPIGR